METLPNEYALEDSDTDTEDELPYTCIDNGLLPVVNRWLRLFQQNRLTQKNFCQYWAEEVPPLYAYTAGCNCLEVTFDEKQIERNLLLPLEQFIWASHDLPSKWNELKSLEKPSRVCGKIFKNGEPIYSCRDCGVDSTCVRCTDCFKRSSHKNHKYRVGMSSGGGFCDCGDLEAWKHDPFCEDHGCIVDKEHKKIGDFIKTLPPDVNARVRIVIRTIVNYCFELLTRDENMSLPEYLNPKEKSNLWVTMLFNDEVHTYDQVNTCLMRAIQCTHKQAAEHASIIDREGRSIIKCGPFLVCKDVCSVLDSLTRRPGPKPLKCHVMELELVAHQNFVIRLLQWLKTLIDRGQVFAMIFGTEMLRKPPMWKRTQQSTSESPRIPAIHVELFDSEPGNGNSRSDRSDAHSDVFTSNMYACTTLLEMVMRTDAQVWKTPRKLWHELFIRGMFLQETLKREFAKRFTRQYVQLQADFIEDDHDVSFSIIDLAIQFYSVPTVAIAMIEQEDALHRVATAFLNEFSLHFDHKLQTFRRETSATHRFRRAQFILADVRRLLGVLPNRWSKKLTKNFLHGFETFMRLLQQMQDMDSVIRQVGQHVEFEPDWDTGIDLQSKVGRTIFKLVEWASSHPPLLYKCIRITLRYLLPKLRMFDVKAVQFKGARISCITYDVSCNAVSVHLPLTRLVCALLLELKRHQPNYDPKVLLPWLPPHIQQLHPLTALMEHSLRTLVMVAQFRSGIWRRNGYSLVNQVFFYHSTQMRDEMLDRDIQLLQLAGAHLEPDEFMVNLLNRFYLLVWYERPHFTPEEIHQLTVTLLEELLGLLLILLSERHVPGIGLCTNEDRVKKEIIQRLCIENLSHSDLLRHFNRHLNEMNVEHLISEVAVFNGQPGQPGGKYELRPEYFDQFNLFFYHYTRQDQCSAEESQLKRKRQQNQRFVCCPPPLPPQFTAQFRSLLRLFTCDTVIGFVQLILKLGSKLPALWYTETLFEKSMHLIGLGLLEQQRELKAALEDGNLTNEEPYLMLDYLDKLKQADIFELLASCEPSCKINSYIQLRLWLKERAQQVEELKQQFDQKVNGLKGCNQTVQLAANHHSTATCLDQKMAQGGTTNGSGPIEGGLVSGKTEQTVRGRNSELAAQRRARIMAQMAAMQNKFIKTNAAYFESETPSGSMLRAGETKSGGKKKKSSMDEVIDTEMSDESSSSVMSSSHVGDHLSSGASVAIGPQVCGQFITQDMHQCILCREEQSQEEGECMVMAAFVQRSTVLSKNRERPAVIPAFCGESIDFCLPSDLHYGVHVSSCGHLMHSKCWSAFFSAVLAKERRRPMRSGRQIVYDAEKNEYLCPLCGCLSNSIIPMITPDAYRRLLRSNSSKGVKVSISDFGEALCNLTGEANHYWAKFLSNGSATKTNDEASILLNHSGNNTGSTLSQDTGLNHLSNNFGNIGTGNSNSSGITTSGKQCFFRRYTPCDLDKAVQGLSEESRMAIRTLLSVYGQQDMLENTLGANVRELMNTLATRIFWIGVGAAPAEHDDRMPMLIYATCAFTIQSVERTQRLDGKSMFADLSSRRYNCLQVLVRFVCLSSVLFLQEQLKSCSVRLMQQLLIPRHYMSCSRSCLDLDAFGLLITLVCAGPSIYTAEVIHGKVKPVMPLGNVFDQQLLHIVFMFHIVQIVLTESELNTDQLMELDSPVEECSNHESRSVVQFYSKLIMAAGIKSPLARANQVDYKVAEKLAVQLKCKLLPFLRCAAVLFHFLSDIKPPDRLFNARPANTDALCEFSMLCEFLGLPKKLSDTFSSRWLIDLAQSWVKHPRLQLLFSNIGTATDAEVPLRLIEQCHQINRLVDLPNDFCDLINEVSQFSCSNSDLKDSKMPTMCLICGQVLCSQSFCCQQDLEQMKVGACVYHASVCGAGVGIFLRIRECRVILISGKSKGCYIDAPYVDEYGETDSGLHRGNPLQFCSVLYDELNKLWLEHRISEKIAHSLEQAPNLSNTHWQIF